MALRTPPLREAHAERGATFTEFGGWDMPVEFDGIRVEHTAVRTAAGLFDVSHMGQLAVDGPDAVALTRRLVTGDVAALDRGEALYAAITDEQGVMLDDTIVYRLPAGGDAELLVVPNAGHDGEMHARWIDHRDEWGMDAVVDNVTDEYAMFALQGPDALGVLAEAGPDADSLARFGATFAEVAGAECLLARTGYTGEDGVELVVPWGDAAAVWDAVDVQPCGLGARDTLRIEAGFLLSGQDFDPDDEPRTPHEAGIDWAVDLDGAFVGREALAAVADRGVDERLVGFRLVDRGVPRHGYDIVTTDDVVVGTVTSGTMSPTLDEPIGMGYVPTEYAEPGTTLRVVVRGEQKSARIEQLPFYEPNQ